MKKYDFVFSLGEACSCSTALRDNGLQIQSFPFDWIALGDLQGRAETVASGFADFFNAEDLEYTNSNGTRSECYLNRKNGYLFTHDFPYKGDFKTDYPVARAKFDRRINRLMHRLKTSRNVLVCYLEKPYVHETEVTSAVVGGGGMTLKKAFPDTDFDILYLSYKKGTDFKSREVISFDGGMLIRFDYKSYAPGATEIDVDKKALKKIFSKIKVNRSFGDKCRIVLTNFVTVAIRGASALVFNRAKRRNWRKKQINAARKKIWGDKGM